MRSPSYLDACPGPAPYPGTMPRASRIAAAALGGGAVVAGGVLVVSGLHAEQPEAAPLPATTYQLSPQQQRSVAAKAAAKPETTASAQSYDRAMTLYIPSQRVIAPLIVESAPQGELTIPGDPKNVAVYRDNPGLDATRGTTVLAGHVTYNGATGAMTRLASLQPGAVVVTTDGGGRPHYWVTTAIEVHDRDDLPTFAKSGDRRLKLVTCGGPAYRTANGWHFEDNVIVTAVPATG